MTEYQERVVEEKQCLDEKLEKLQMFIESNETFKTLQEAEQNRLHEQCSVMMRYSEILKERIANFCSDPCTAEENQTPSSE